MRTLPSTGLPVLQASLIAALALAGCSTQPAETAGEAGQEMSSGDVLESHAESGLDVIPLAVVTPDGNRHRFRVEVARSPAEQARGLMFRTRMGEDEGMLFPRDPPAPASFWMKNTVLPLDIVFIDQNRRVLNVVANTVPYLETQVTSDGSAAAVLELNAGRAKELGIVQGSQVNW